MSRIFVGNVYSDLMIDAYIPSHSDPLVNVSPRKIWLADEGDVVCAMRPVRPELAAHVGGVLGADTAGIDIIQIDPHGVGHELDAIVTSERTFVLSPYALDRRTAALSRRLGVPVEGYDAVAPAGVADRIHALNSKSGFREAAGRLGLPIPAGAACAGLDGLREEARRMLAVHPEIIVKLDRSSNGFGNLVLTREQLGELDGRLEVHLSRHPGPTHRFVVEAFLPFVSLPSVEMMVDASGVHPTYICDQRRGPQGGMVAPPESLPDRAIDALLVGGRTWGQYLFDLGYRGTFDVDGGWPPSGDVCFTESNVRRTAGTHLHEIACKLLGCDYQADRCWVSGSVGTRERSFSRMVARLGEAGLSYDERTRTGVVFPVDEPHDEKCFYQVFARSNAEAFDVERRIAALV